jgi:hypothetical protein
MTTELSVDPSRSASTVERRDGELRVVHAIPGRIRIRVEVPPNGPKDLGRLYWWEKRIRGLDGVLDVSANPPARSLRVLYEAESFNPYLELGLDREESEPSAPGAGGARAPSSTTAQQLARWFWNADRRVWEATGGKLDLKLAIPASLVAYGLWEAALGAEMATTTLQITAWYAYNVFMHMHPREMITPGPVPDPAV